MVRKEVIAEAVCAMLPSPQGLLIYSAVNWVLVARVAKDPARSGKKQRLQVKVNGRLQYDEYEGMTHDAFIRATLIHALH